MLLALCLSLAPTALAQNCDNPSSASEADECATLRLRAAQRELNEVYGALLDSEDKDFAAAVRKAQEAWVTWRDAEAGLAAKAAHGQEALARKKQEAQMTEDRVRDLRSYSGY